MRGVVVPVSAQAPRLWEAYDAWLRRTVEVIGGSADALDAMNVFPIPDADTGANLRLTLEGIARAEVGPGQSRADAIAQAAILSAHGNSGAILAEMFTRVCRTVETATQPHPNQPHPNQPQSAQIPAVPPGVMVGELLQTAARAARRSVARPVEGTILTVADATAAAAVKTMSDRPDDAQAVAEAAQAAAHRALAQTPGQNEVLAAAGVVDAGAQAYVLLVDVLVETLGGAPARALAPALLSPGQLTRRPVPTTALPTEYEVMYALRGAPDDALAALREELSDLGHSVVIVGDQAVAQVHVHLAEAGAAVEAALGRGVLSQLRITALPAHSEVAERAVLAVVAGSGLAAAVTSLGGLPVRNDAGDLTVERLTAAAEASCGDLIVLPNDMASLEIAHHHAMQWRREGRRVAVIPTVAQVQGLAAMAVHEPTADFDSAVVTMSSAAGHTRHGAVTIAESAAMTMAGRCEPGQVLGVVEGDFVEIGDTVSDVAWRVVERLLAGGGELLTLVQGRGADPGVSEALTSQVISYHPDVDVEALKGDQSRYLLLLGVE